MFKYPTYVVLAKPPFWLILTISLIMGIGFGVVELSNTGVFQNREPGIQDLILLYTNTWEAGLQDFIHCKEWFDHTSATPWQLGRFGFDAAAIVQAMTALAANPETINILPEFIDRAGSVVNTQISSLSIDLRNELNLNFIQIEDAIIGIREILAHPSNIDNDIIAIQNWLSEICKNYCYIFFRFDGSRQELISIFWCSRIPSYDGLDGPVLSYEEGLRFLHTSMASSFQHWLS